MKPCGKGSRAFDVNVLKRFKQPVVSNVVLPSSWQVPVFVASGNFLVMAMVVVVLVCLFVCLLVWLVVWLVEWLVVVFCLLFVGCCGYRY